MSAIVSCAILIRRTEMSCVSGARASLLDVGPLEVRRRPPQEYQGYLCETEGVKGSYTCLV